VVVEALVYCTDSPLVLQCLTKASISRLVKQIVHVLVLNTLLKSETREHL